MLKKFVNNHPLAVRFMCWIGFPLLVVAGGGKVYLNQSLPQVTGSKQLNAITEPVELSRDSNGVVYIIAKSDKDAFSALGYAHAQDRLWQMDFQRRLAQGRLAEILGPSSLPSDQFMRTLGIYRAAKASVNSLDKLALDSLEAYAQGVNDYLAENNVLPPEYQILSIKPERWQIADSLVLFKLLALGLDGNYRKDLAYELLVKTIGEQKAKEINVSHPKNGIVVVNSEVDKNYTKKLNQVIQVSEAMFQEGLIGGEGVGSNAWVVSGKYTESGKPLLANDPHLKTQMPSNWYLANIRGDKLNVSGATIPGAPIVISGHNNKISWGITALKADVQDVFLERTHPNDDNLYEVEGNWVEMQVVEETINVRTEFPTILNNPFKPVIWHARSTRHGPLISDVSEKGDIHFALQWTGLSEVDTSYASFFELNYAQNWQEFRHSLSQYKAPALNFLYADKVGNIGYTAAGEIPIRSSGYGRTPSLGWQSEGQWVGTIEHEQLPHTYNPRQGFIVTANNKIHDDKYPFYISDDWSPGYRAARITEMLERFIQQGLKVTFKDMSVMQGDVKNIQAMQLVKLFTQVQGKTKLQREAIVELRNWDFESNMDSTAASIFHAWQSHFSKSILEGVIYTERLHQGRTKALQNIVNQMYPIFLNALVNGDIEHWCDNTKTAVTESCVDRAADSLPHAIRDLELVGGRSLSDWKWGDIHKAYYPHAVFSNIKLLDYVFDREAPSGGDHYTVNVAMTRFSKDKGYQQVTGASFRSVIDLSNLNGSGYVIDTGQSGNLLSPHYDDLMDVHNQNELIYMQSGKQSTSRDVLLLLPVQPN